MKLARSPQSTSTGAALRTQTPWVLVQLWYTGTRQYPSFVATTSPCHGLTATFYHDSSRTMYAGEVHFLHTHPYANVIGTSYDVNGGDHYYRDLGEVSGWENSGCAWTAPHLHQSADTSAGTAFYTNWNGDPTTSWVHLIQ